MKPGSSIHIHEPCQVSWKSMEPGKGSRFCKSCQTPVVDFSKKSVEEIEAFFKEHHTSPVCGRYHARHAAQPSRGMRLLNKLEACLQHTPFKRVALYLAACSVLFTNCIMGKRAEPEPWSEKPEPKTADTTVRQRNH